MSIKTKVLAILSFLAVGLFLSLSVSAATVVNTSGNVSLPSLNQGLVGWWTFDAKDRTATRVIDKSGNGNAGTVEAGINGILGKIGQAAIFTGTTNRLTVLNNNFLNSTNFTISWWTNLPSQGVAYSGFNLINKYSYNASGVGLAFGTGGSANNRYISFWTRTGVSGENDCKPGFIPTASDFTFSAWHNFVITLSYDNVATTTISAYLNGKLISSSNCTGPYYPNTNNMTIGDPFTGSSIGRKANAKIDDLRIYNRSLSLKEIQALYQMGGGKINKSEAVKPNLNSGLVGWWTMDSINMNSTSIFDRSGNNMTLTKGPLNMAAAGKVSQGLRFNGYNDVSASKIGGIVQITQPSVSICTWVQLKNDNSGLSNGILAQYGTLNNSNGFGIGINGSERLSWRINGSFNNYIGPILKFGKWSHECMTWDGSTVRMYENGSLFTTASYVTSTITAETQITIGGRVPNSHEVIDGIIDDVRVYNRLLSAQEIQMLYQQGGNKVNVSETTRPNLNSGLVGYWTFDGKDWASSLVALDKSGNGNNGTLNGGVTKVSGKIGQGLKFNGTSGRVVLPNISANNFTILAWIKPTAIEASLSRIFEQANYNIDFSLHPNGFLSLYDGAWHYSTTNAVTLNQWQYVGVIYDGSSITFYRNGVLFGKTTGGRALSGVSYIGSTHVPDANAFFVGSVDDVRIYNRALSAQEIKLLYKMGK